MKRETTPAGLENLRRLAVSETGFIFDPGTGMTYHVNVTGRFLLQQLQAGLSLDRIEHALQEAFEVDGEDLERDIVEFVHMLRENELTRNEVGS